MSQGMIVKVFPGANTSRGFYSLYNYIIPQDTTRIFIIKGGPGVGKSTFMKRICANMVNRGFRAEWHCCSSDNGSIDGVVFPELGVAMIDGTAPQRVVTIGEQFLLLFCIIRTSYLPLLAATDNQFC